MTRELETGLKVLADQFAGRQFRVPRDPSKLLRRLGDELDAASAEAVCKEFGGRRLYARKASHAAAEARNSLIRVRRTHGATLEALAEEFGLSARHISNILKDYDNALPRLPS